MAKRISKAVRARRVKVSEFLRQGMTQREIAVELDVSDATICRDSQQLAEEWKAAVPSNMSAWRNRDLRHLDDINRQAKIRFKETGSVQFLRVQLDVLRRRSKLLGYDQPVQFDVRVDSTWRDQPIKDMSAGELRAAIEAAEQAVADSTVARA